MTEQKKQTKRGVRIAALVMLVAAGVVVILRARSQQNILGIACLGLYYVCMLYYGLKGYQKPHGNMVQIMMMILAVYVASTAVAVDARWGLLPWITLLASSLAAVLMGFMAGRLQKAEENRTTAILVSILLFVRCLWFLENLSMPGGDRLPYVLDRGVALLLWTALALIYFVRYEEHRHAGEAAPVNNSAS